MNAQPAQAQKIRMRDKECNEEISDIVCWSRMHTEAGEGLASIVARKDLERRAGDGIFWWGVGNAPSRATVGLAQRKAHVDVLFSKMKSKPKPQDTKPAALYVWRQYVDVSGQIRDLPPNALITSRGELTGIPRSHYALVCKSDDPLVVGDLGVFNPGVYRNVGRVGGCIGASQVTVLATRAEDIGRVQEYRISMRARLVGAYWTRIVNPVELSPDTRSMLEQRLTSLHSFTIAEWGYLIKAVRGTSPLKSVQKQPSLWDSKGA